eukprot:TRINITY_DN6672_c0_g1_i10.p1 TRINITY_DN6672_c0_g1~~TRINITY_DN6672_c0_g1_i10.p1  ORF type:complete len:189 (+),score=-14.22 TRINITY_DN6672_c0_g1_i10:931-1497(+)
MFQIIQYTELNQHTKKIIVLDTIVKQQYLQLVPIIYYIIQLQYNICNNKQNSFFFCSSKFLNIDPISTQPITHKQKNYKRFTQKISQQHQKNKKISNKKLVTVIFKVILTCNISPKAKNFPQIPCNSYIICKNYLIYSYRFIKYSNFPFLPNNYINMHKRLNQKQQPLIIIFIDYNFIVYQDTKHVRS